MRKLQETKKALIVVRTYPTPAKSGVEVSCTAAITDKGEWLRLFPVPWRSLPADQRFRKYQWVELTVTKASDPRPESYKLKPDGIRVLSEPLTTARGWRARKEVVFPLRAHCLCCLQKQRDVDGHPTLGVFRPKLIERLAIKSESSTWTDSQLAVLRQGHLFAESPKKELEKIPFSFRYEFRCEHDECSGHKVICTDWEMGESYRQWKATYGDKWESKFRERYESDMIRKCDTHFYVGTVHQHPHIWIIVGLFYPPRSDEGPGLFDRSELSILA
jgi:hypothetical protein